MNPAVSSVTDRRLRRIAVVDPKAATDSRIERAMQLLSAIVWALKGTTRAEWIAVSRRDQPDVVAIYVDDADAQRTLLKVWIPDEGTHLEPHTLVYPFRREEVHKLLDTLDGTLCDLATRRSRPAADGWIAQFTANVPWSAIHTLRSMRTRLGSHWVVGARAGEPLLWLSPQGDRYCADAETIAALRQGSLRLTDLTLYEDDAPPAHARLRPGVELTWCTAYHASPELAPWLDGLARYRAPRWPQVVSLIRASGATLRITSALVATELDLAEIQHRTDASPEEAARTLNALIACDAVRAGETRAVTDLNRAQPLTASVGGAGETRAATDLKRAQPPAASVGALHTLLRRVRKHLGIAG